MSFEIITADSPDVIAARDRIVRVLARGESVRSDRMWDAAQQIASEEWARVERLTGRVLLSIEPDGRLRVR